MKKQKTKISNKFNSNCMPSPNQLCGLIENDIFDIAEHIGHCRKFLEFTQKVYGAVGYNSLYLIDEKVLKYIEICARESIMLNSKHADKCAYVAENFGKDDNIMEADVVYAEGITDRLKQINTISHDKMAYLQEMVLSSLNDYALDEEDKNMIKGFNYDENELMRLFHGENSHLKRHNQMVNDIFNDFKVTITPFVLSSYNPNASKEKRQINRDLFVVTSKKTMENKEEEPEL